MDRLLVHAQRRLRGGMRTEGEAAGEQNGKLAEASDKGIHYWHHGYRERK
jgi:hypothetical protein